MIINKSKIVAIFFILNSAIIQDSSANSGFANANSSFYTLKRYKGINNKDTSIFSRIKYNENNLLSFNDNNTISINSRGIKLIAKDESEDEFTLFIKIKNKLVLTKKHIKGISKVLIEKDYLMFSLWTYSDEDGNNEGYGYIFNLNNNLVKTFSKKLVNTCNPAFFNNNFYFIDGLRLIRTDLDLNIKNSLSLVYISKKRKDLAYLDTYLISGILKKDNTRLIINFSPEKSTKFEQYVGSINITTKVIVLK